VWHLYAAEVVELIRLAESLEAPHLATALKYGDRLTADPVQDPGPTCGQFGSREV